MAGGTCKCGLCTLRMSPNGWLTPRAQRLRGFEIELSNELIDGITADKCGEHRTFCATATACPEYRKRMTGGDCDCEACARDAEKAGKLKKEWKCPGHSCIEAAGTPQKWLKTVVASAARKTLFPVKGDFTTGGGRQTERDNEYFDLKTDGSCGYEIATPPVEGVHVAKALGPVLAALGVEEARHKVSFVNGKCGLHCTFDVQDLGTRNIKQVVFTALRHQAALVATQPAYRKGNGFCKFVNGAGAVRRIVAKGEILTAAAKATPPFADRRTFINMTELDRKLIEFRFGGATTDPKQMEAFGVMLECLIDASITRPAIADTNNRKRRMEQEIILPYIKDPRVEKAWVECLRPQMESNELARI